MQRRRALLHVGTHKTGTTSIQVFLDDNVRALGAAGIYVPRAGRHRLGENAVTPGHHDVAWELMSDRTESLGRAAAEASAFDAPTVVMSSEELHLLHTHPRRMALLRETLEASGYEPTIVIYLREQAGYIASLFAELAKKNGSWRFVDFLESAFALGAFAANPDFPIPLTYSRLLADFAGAFGAERVIARPYVASSDPHALLRDFLRVTAALHGPLQLANLNVERALENTRITFADVLMQIHAFARERNPAVMEPLALAVRAGIDPNDPMLSARFSPIRYEDRLAIVRHFAADNARVEQSASIVIPGTRESEIPPSDDASWNLANVQRPFLDFVLNAWFR